MVIKEGYIYSMRDGIFMYKGMKLHGGHNVVLAHEFEIIKKPNNITRDVKPWQKYVLYSNGVVSVDTNMATILGCSREIFLLMKYEPTLTVLYGQK